MYFLFNYCYNVYVFIYLSYKDIMFISKHVHYLKVYLPIFIHLLLSLLSLL